MKRLILLILILLGVVAEARAQGAGTAASIYKTTFANLGTPANGSVRYCTDCNANTSPCTGGGTGAFANRVAGAWSCETASGSGVTGAGAAGRVAVWDSASNLTSDTDLTFATDTLTATKIIGSTSITDSALTAGRVTLAGTAGLLTDDSDLTFSTDTLTATKIGAFSLAGNITGAGNGITGIGSLGLSNTNTKLAINTTNTTGGIEFQESDVGKAQLVISGGDTYFDYYGTLNLRTGLSGTLRASLTTAGLFTTTTLAVSGIASDAGHTDSTVCQDTTTHIFFAGSGAAGICLGTSSARYKHGIKDNDLGLSRVLALRTRSFFYNKGFGDGGQKRLYGFVAEEVDKVMPELVGYNAAGQPNSVDWAGMVPVLAKAIQELNEKVVAQQKEITKLKRQMRRR